MEEAAAFEDDEADSDYEENWDDFEYEDEYKVVVIFSFDVILI